MLLIVTHLILQGSGVHDGFCEDYCDLLFDKCKDEFYDPYADKSITVPICKSESLLCSKISDHVSTGRDFCNILGFQASKLKEPVLGGPSLENDCFNGRSSVGVKYDRLEIDYDLVEKRDDIDAEDDAEGFFGDNQAAGMLTN